LYEESDDDECGAGGLVTADGENDPGDRQSEEDDERYEDHREQTRWPAL
jgi:hypothetical protein